MLRILAVTVLGLGMMMSGCTTTQQVIAKVQSSSDTPLDQVLKMRPDLRNELATVEIRQFFNNVESPTVGQVKVTETGLMDDSVRSVQTIYHFKKEDKKWKIQETEKSYRCMRGANTKTFQKAVCP
ncbi:MULTISPECIES: hypothetical protein [unclassified Acinetobacter]|uniref:hypothetical protein n=1 Tax=unclassified Acinetobacter TaxID=196816 RepID=UPI001C24ED9B|nr:MULTISPECIES: hypothetical protein [unclassified Acinetobacter]